MTFFGVIFLFFCLLQDYVLRAKDFNSKKQRLKALQQKASSKNPDEFYFQMHSSSLKARPLRRLFSMLPLPSHTSFRTVCTETTLALRSTWIKFGC